MTLTLEEFVASRRAVPELHGHPEADPDYQIEPGTPGLLYAGNWHIEGPDERGEYTLVLAGYPENLVYRETLPELERRLWREELHARSGVSQTSALDELRYALDLATKSGLLDELAISIHPDVINGFCDAVSEMEVS